MENRNPPNVSLLHSVFSRSRDGEAEEEEEEELEHRGVGSLELYSENDCTFTNLLSGTQSIRAFALSRASISSCCMNL